MVCRAGNILKGKNKMTEEQNKKIARDTLALYHYGKLYDQLPDDGAEQDWICTEAEEKIKEGSVNV